MNKPYDLVKRLLDIVFALVLLVLLGPFMLMTAFLVKLTSPDGPVIYRAERTGRGGRPFHMVKFRTMVPNADKIGSPVTVAGDPRITPIGKFLRLSKLDEFPQLWNVLRGDMSFVGPRPNVRFFTDKYTEAEAGLLSVPQGITDYASLYFRRQEVMFSGSKDSIGDYELFVAPLKVPLGLFYARTYSLGTDLKILIATVLALFLKVDPRWCFPKALLQEIEPHEAQMRQAMNL